MYKFTNIYRVYIFSIYICIYLDYCTCLHRTCLPLAKLLWLSTNINIVSVGPGHKPRFGAWLMSFSCSWDAQIICTCRRSLCCCCCCFRLVLNDSSLVLSSGYCGEIEGTHTQLLKGSTLFVSLND